MDVWDAVAIDADELGRVAARGVEVGRVWTEADRGEVEHPGDLLGRLRAGAEVGMETRCQAEIGRQVSDPVEPVRQESVIRVGRSTRANRAAADHEVGGAKLSGKLRRAANLVQLLPQDLRKDEVGAGVDPNKLQLELFHQPAQLAFPVRVLDEIAFEELEPGVAAAAISRIASSVDPLAR